MAELWKDRGIQQAKAAAVPLVSRESVAALADEWEARATRLHDGAVAHACREHAKALRHLLATHGAIA